MLWNILKYVTVPSVFLQVFLSRQVDGEKFKLMGESLVNDTQFEIQYSREADVPRITRYTEGPIFFPITLAEIETGQCF